VRSGLVLHLLVTVLDEAAIVKLDRSPSPPLESSSISTAPSSTVAPLSDSESGEAVAGEGG
jgi:hypothetical protein